MTAWRPYGWDTGVRLGVLTPHADVGPESELRAMAPPEVGLHAARVPFAAMGPRGSMEPTIAHAAVRAFAEPPAVDEAAEHLAAAPVDAIGFAFTSTGYVVGAAGERAMVERLGERAGGIPVVTTCEAAAGALRDGGAQRLALVSPPWFDAELDRLGAEYFRAAGFDVVQHRPAPLPSDQMAIRPHALFEAVRDATPDDADAVFVGGNGFRAVGTIDALEAELDRPVLTANQALLHRLLAEAGTGLIPDGYGQIFELEV